MNLEQLRGLIEIAETGHFTQAAERLHLAQPSLSRQIQSLESELGAEIFHRIRGGVTLTAAGERLLPIARRMLSDADLARSEIAELTGLRRGRIRLGATPTLCASLVADVLAEFHPLYPRIDIEILESGSRTLIDALMEGALDVALIVRSVSSPAARAVLDLEPILSERLVVVSSLAAPNPFPGDEPVTLRELAATPQIAFPRNYDLRATMDAAYRASELTPVIVAEGAEMDAALRFAERGIGVVVVPALVATQHPNLRTALLADTALSRTVSIARRSDMSPAHASAAIHAIISGVADRLASGDGAGSRMIARVGTPTL